MTTYNSALLSALNSHFLLLQHAHPEMPVAEMPPQVAFGTTLAEPMNSHFKDQIQKLVKGEALAKVILESSPASSTEEIDRLVRATARSVERMIQGALELSGGPIEAVLERFQAAELVRKNPNSPEAWQVYGDYLLECGDPRGELIQLEQAIEKAQKLPAEEYLDRKREVEATEKVRRKLDARYRKEFFSKTGANIVPPGSRNRYHSPDGWRYGYLHKLNVRSAHPDKLLQIFQQEEARFLSSLDLSSRHQADVLECLRLPQIKSIKSLRFSGTLCFQGDSIVRTVAESSHIGALEYLGLYSQRLSHEGFRTLAHSSNFRSLSVLDFGDDAIDDEGVRSLIASTPPSLKKVVLWRTAVGDETLKAVEDWARERNIKLILKPY